MVYEVNNTSSDSSISAEEFQYYILQQDWNTFILIVNNYTYQTMYTEIHTVG